MDPRTAKRYAESPQRPEYMLSRRKPSKVDAYKNQIDLWLEEAPILQFEYWKRAYCKYVKSGSCQRAVPTDGYAETTAFASI